MFEILTFVNGHEVVTFHCFCHFGLHFEPCVEWALKSSYFSFLPSEINVFVDTGFSIVAACARCWIAIPTIASSRRLMELFESESWIFGVCSNHW